MVNTATAIKWIAHKIGGALARVGDLPGFKTLDKILISVLYSAVTVVAFFAAIWLDTMLMFTSMTPYESQFWCEWWNNEKSLLEIYQKFKRGLI